MLWYSSTKTRMSAHDTDFSVVHLNLSSHFLFSPFFACSSLFPLHRFSASPSLPSPRSCPRPHFARTFESWLTLILCLMPPCQIVYPFLNTFVPYLTSSPPRTLPPNSSPSPPAYVSQTIPIRTFPPCSSIETGKSRVT